MLSSPRAKNIVIALSLAAAALVIAYRRVLPLLVDFASYSDGAREYDASERSLRRAVWDPAQPLAGDADGAGRESHPVLSPDGRWLVFAAGDADSGNDLYIAEMVGGVAREVRALARLNSAADDASPSFGETRLYFASNRPGGRGGYDLYSAEWNGDDFGEPEPVGGGVNTVFDELDPARRSNELCFASNRAHEGRGDFDLYLARDAGEGQDAQVASLAALDTPFDEREPSFGADGKALYFASNREGTRGAFDLFQSFEDRDGWLAPQPIDALNTAASERAPAPSRDGFQLVFARESDADSGAPDLWRATSHELFRIPRGPSGWRDLAYAGAFVLLALLTWLAKRWHQLDILWKCFLVSLLVHALLMLWSNYINPEGGGYTEIERGPDSFQVHLAPSDEEVRALSERGGDLGNSRPDESASIAIEEPQRADLGASLADAGVAPAAAPLLASARAELADAPAPSAASVEPSVAIERADEVQLAAPNETFERHVEPSHELGLDLRKTNDIAHSVAGASEPSEASIDGGDPLGAATPGSAPIVARRGQPLGDSGPTGYRPGAAAPSIASSASIGDGPALEQPHENLVAHAAQAPSGPSLSPRSFAQGRSETGGGGSGGPQAQPSSVVTSGLGNAARDAAPVTGSALALHRQDVAAAAVEGEGFAPSASAPSRGQGSEPSGPALEQPHEQLARASLAPGAGGNPSGTGTGAGAGSQPGAGHGSGGPGLPAPIAMHGGRSDTTEAGAPTGRLDSAGNSLLSTRVGSGGDTGPAASPLVATPRAGDRDLPAGPARLADTPYRSRFGGEKQIALREHGGTVETERAVALGLQYLTSRQHENGAWGDENDRNDKYRDVRVGKSALALLAFLGAGHTPQSNTQFSSVAERAVRFLLSTQDESTGHFGDSEAYSHGVSTYALAECFAITRDERLRAPLEAAVAQILRHQLTRGGRTRTGGWSYYYPDGATFDSYPRTSITAWQVMALESARLGGLAVPDQTFDSAREFLLNAWDGERGSFRYNHDPQRLNSGYSTLPGSTPAGLFALSLLGEDIASPTWAQAIDFVTQRSPSGYRFTGDDDFVERAQGNLYFWYYGSLALLRHGGPEWERWNTALKETLLPSQQRNGSWQPIDIYSRYAGDDDDDRIYATAMCVLTLEVYYRYFTPLLKVR
jgi:hypothetical protein